jgi:hypothetical protein
MDMLSLRYKHDRDPNDDFGRLTLSVQNEKFSAKGGFWVQWQDVVEFANSLQAYPIQSGEPVTVQWGYNMQEGDDLIIKITIASKNATGDLSVSVEIRDEDEPSIRAQIAFRSGYPAVDLFRSDIIKLMAGEMEEAILHGY